MPSVALLVDKALVAGLMTETSKRWIDREFMNAYTITGVTMGTDWTSGSLYGDDWGEAFGPLVRYRYPDEASNCILAKLPDGSAEVVVGVLPSEVKTLMGKEEFGRYLDP